MYIYMYSIVYIQRESERDDTQPVTSLYIYIWLCMAIGIKHDLAPLVY